ncbi:MAG: FAD-dependent oxidoreductase, partial [Acidiferrobacterales bacterium]
NWQTDEVARFAGLRVLPRSESSAFSRPRETVFHQDKNHPNLFSIYGGKLTGYRATAEKMMKKIKHLLPAPENKLNKKTDEVMLTHATGHNN